MSFRDWAIPVFERVYVNIQASRIGQYVSMKPGRKGAWLSKDLQQLLDIVADMRHIQQKLGPHHYRKTFVIEVIQRHLGWITAFNPLLFER